MNDVALAFMNSVLKAQEGDWEASEKQVLEALDKLKGVQHPALWRSAIQQSLKIHRRLRPRAS